MSADLTTFQHYYALADQLIDQSSKEALAERARLLALIFAHAPDLVEGLLVFDEKDAVMLDWRTQNRFEG